MSATNTAASAERWFRDVFCQFEKEQAAAAGQSVYARLHEAARQIPPGAEGLFFHPYLLGERSPYWDPQSARQLRRRHDAAWQAALRPGTAGRRGLFAPRLLPHNRGYALPVDEIRLIGGGAQSDLWTQIISDVFGRPIVRPAGCDASFGAALLAGVGVGLFAGTADAAQRCIRVRDTVEPCPKAVRIYDQLFTLYCQIHDDLAKTYANLHKVLNDIHTPSEAQP